MRRLTIATLMVALALPVATAVADDECSTWTVEHMETTPLLTLNPDDYGNHGFRTAMVGHYLWASFDDGAVLSIAIPDDAVKLTVCVDGTVTFVSAPVVTDNEVELAPAVQVINLIDYWQGEGWKVY